MSYLHGTTAFTSYGLFWLSLVFLLLLPKLGLADAATPFAIGWYLLVWGVFTTCLFVGTLRLTHALQFVFASLTLLFFLLAIGDFTGNKVITITAGYEGILCGMSAFYTGIAQVLNEVYGKTILPLWPVEKK